MNASHSNIPAGVIASFVFLVIAIGAAAPMYDAVSHPQDGFNGYGQGWAGIICIIFISIPASFISLFCGLASVSKSKLAYISIMPTLIFLLYCGYTWIQIKQ